MNLIESLRWRYATKKFDATKKVSTEDLAVIQEAIQLTATSYGLQLFKVLIVENKETRAKLQPVSWGQTQIVDASHLLVFCNHKKIEARNIDSFVTLKAKTQGIAAENLQGYANFMHSKLAEKTPSEIENWTAKQVYIALGNAMAACGELKIDACPIEGFQPDQYTEILELEDKNLQPAVVLAVGYRSAEDGTASAPKVRRSIDELFETV